MQDRPGGRRPPAIDDVWWKSHGEGYWRALLEQGEIAPGPVLPDDPEEILYPVLVESESNGEGQVAGDGPGDGSLPSGQEWAAARRALDQGELLSLRVVGANRGGLLVEWNRIEGFVPASHLKDVPRTRDPQARATDLAKRVGDVLSLRLIEVDEPQRRLVFSERAAGSSAGSPAAVPHTLRPGDTCSGRIINLTSFGAFVDLGGGEGLVHISEISWDRLRHPADRLRPGDEVQVSVLGVDPEQGRIALSLKRLRPNPWALVGSRYQVGQIVEGAVTNVVSFGAFVRLEEGLEGLIHVSELADGSLMHPRSVVREGDRVRVRVVHVEPDKRRLGLSLRQAREADGPA